MKDFCAKQVDLAKAKYYKKYFEEYKQNSRKQWEMINSLLNRSRKRIGIKKLIDKEGNIINTPTAIAEHFNEYFSHIASNLKGDSSDEAPNNLHEQFLRHRQPMELKLDKVQPKEIFDAINNLKNKATLDTKISALKIANTSRKFTKILANIVVKSFKEGLYPHQLKTARVALSDYTFPSRVLRPPVLTK